jgi:beta-N-acetylhexosaminidase
VYPPAGVILFARNIEDRRQLASLVAALRRVLSPQAVLMVDQEGGRVARLRPPHWRAHPPPASLGELFAHRPGAGLRAAWLTGALIGDDSAAAGFDVVAAPVLDLAIPGAHAVIGDRALAVDPVSVARLGRSLAAGLLAAGVQPVGKHAPGHGRSGVDSHLSLPRVEANHLDADLLPFALNTDLPWAMSAHIVYPTWDAALPATLSPTVIGEIIRGRIGFGGVLVTDDLAMKALSGTPADLALRSLAAGCDVALYCSGEYAPTADLLATCPNLTGAAAGRLAAAHALALRRRQAIDAGQLSRERDRLLA